MKRRKFIKSASTVAAVPILLNGLNIRAKASPIFEDLAKIAADNDRILVVIQLQGGNDGLNTVLPLDQYSNLSKARQNILVDEKKALKLTDSTALHPSMSGMASLYKDGKLGIVQSAGYPNQNFSHFRSTDIWTSASEYNEVITSGWLGRYLDTQFPGYPDNYPNLNQPHPPSISVGSVVSNTCQGEVYTLGMAISSLDEFYKVRNDGEDDLPYNTYGEEVNFVRSMVATTKTYNSSIEEAAKVGKNLSQKYPTSNSNTRNTGNLPDQLKIIAKLISGGLKTRVYVATIGGFDTHSDQIETQGSTSGMHETLLKTLSDSIAAFQDDLKLLGLEDRVMGMTFSEFGRRIISNSSLGTDHGSAAPLFVFGTNANPVIHGVNPTIPSKVTDEDNLPMQFDFRAIYTSFLKDWFGVESAELKKIMMKDFATIPLIKVASSVVKEDDINLHFYPNPVSEIGFITFNSIGSDTKISVLDLNGVQKMIVLDKYIQEGNYRLPINVQSFQTGTYFIKIESKDDTIIKTFQVLR
jgi:uncharacterized protein (DUF1501 family)